MIFLISSSRISEWKYISKPKSSKILISFDTESSTLPLKPYISLKYAFSSSSCELPSASKNLGKRVVRLLRYGTSKHK